MDGTMIMLDLFAGLGGASQAMRGRSGWRVIRVEREERFRPDVVADISRFSLRLGARVDLLWASPPCTEFSRESMPWCRTGTAPSLELVRASMRLVEEIRPRWWVIENVRGARKWLEPLLGRPTMRIGAAYLWGSFPLLIGYREPAPHKWHMSPSPNRPALRSKIPIEISEALRDACERERDAALLGGAA